MGAGIYCLQEPPALILRIYMGDMLAWRVFCPDLRQICMVSPLLHEFGKPVQKDFFIMQRPVRPALLIDKVFRHFPGQALAFVAVIKAEMVSPARWFISIKDLIRPERLLFHS